MTKYDVFLSHNTADDAAVEIIARRLREEALLEPFLDRWHLVPGRPWQEALEEALDGSDTCAVFLGPNSIGTWENEEMRVALEIRTARPDYRVIPVLLPGSRLPERGRLPRFLARHTWVDFRSGLDDPDAFHRLVCGIKGIAPGQENAAAGVVCPFRGLQIFDTEHARFFFGREALTQHLVEQLREDRFLAVVGPSGSGKSSLVRAGLIPQLHAGTLPTSDRWPIVSLKPGPQPLETLAARLIPHLGPVGDPLATRQSLLENLQKDERGLHHVVQTILAGAPNSQRLVLMIDQFEELFTLDQNEQNRENFVANMLYASAIAGGQTITVITMRADFFGKCAAYPDLAIRLSERDLLVGPMNDDELRRAMQNPARLVSLEYEKGLIDTILEDLGNEPGSLPLLQHTLLELWGRRRGHWLTIDAYREIGGTQGALAQRADKIYHKFTPEQQSAIQQIMLRLTQPGEGTEDTRRRATFAELLPASGETTQIVAAVQALADARLLTTDRDEHGNEIVDVAHEALISHWPRLQKWIDDNRAGLRTHRQLTETATEWEKRDHDDSFLYRGARLAEAVEWANDHLKELNISERKFLDVSRSHQVSELEAVQKQAARLRTRVILLASALIIALIAVATAWWQGRVAQSRELAASAISQLPVDPELSILLALQAASKTDFIDGSITTQALDALHQAVQASHIQLTLSGHTGSVTKVVFNLRGNRLATASADGTAKIWDAVSGEELLTLSGHTDVVSDVALSPDEKYLATASWDKTAKLWNTASGKMLLTFTAHQERVRSVAFSPDSTRLATASDDKTVKVWGVPSGEELFTLSGHTAWVKAVAFSPDGQYLITASDDETAKIWDAQSGKELLTLSGHTYLVSGVAFSPDGKRAATASDDMTAKVWDAQSGQEIMTLSGHTNALLGVAFSPDGRRLATASVDGTAKVWDLSSGLELFTLVGHTNPVNSVAFNPDGTRLATAGVDGGARVWDVSFSHMALVSAVAFSPDGTRLATASDDNTTKVWDVHSGQVLLTLAGHTNQVKDVTYSPDGRRLATVSDDRTIKLWDANSGELLLTLYGHTHGINSVIFSPDGNYLATASDDKTVRTWDVSTGRELLKLSDYTNWVADVVYNPDGTLIATAAGDGIKVRESVSGRELMTLSTDQVYSVAFSPDGRQLASAELNNTSRVWDISSGKQLLTLSGHTNAVFGVAFSPDGTRLATASWDKTAKVWDAISGQELLTLNHMAEVYDITFSPDGTRVATASADKRGHIYLLNVNELIDLARTHLTRSLTSAECQKYLHKSQCPDIP